MSLKNLTVHTTIPASDIDRAKTWYSDKLGLKPAREMPGRSWIYEVGGGTSFALYPTDNAGQAPSTLMFFSSNDLEGDVKAMQDNGVVFENYDLPGLKTENGIAHLGNTSVGWFKDSENNILAIGQSVT